MTEYGLGALAPNPLRVKAATDAPVIVPEYNQDSTTFFTHCQPAVLVEVGVARHR